MLKYCQNLKAQCSIKWAQHTRTNTDSIYRKDSDQSNSHRERRMIMWQAGEEKNKSLCLMSRVPAWDENFPEREEDCTTMKMYLLPNGYIWLRWATYSGEVEAGYHKFRVSLDNMRHTSLGEEEGTGGYNRTKQARLGMEAYFIILAPRER